MASAQKLSLMRSLPVIDDGVMQGYCTPCTSVESWGQRQSVSGQQHPKKTAVGHIWCGMSDRIEISRGLEEYFVGYELLMNSM
jgi:hypothetical protein